ncbi:MAG: hypothetical protein Q4E75_02945 [bacterium]|nr:hypothetical protein [bacterium]
MASRMDKYYNDDSSKKVRSSRNQSLYDQIKNLENYTNIEGVATIEKTNEIDISKVQELVKNRENYNKQKKYRSIINKPESKIENIPVSEEENTKTYDIKDILSKVENKPKDKNRSLKKEQIEVLKSLDFSDKKKDIEKEEEELKELINTIVSKKTIDKDDVGLLDELKSDTMVGTASSIKKIIEEEKSGYEEDNDEIDKSFYTSSFGFTKKDFEELKDINHNIKKSNKYIIILLIALLLLIIGFVVYFIFS